MKILTVVFLVLMYLSGKNVLASHPHSHGMPKKLSDISDRSDIGCDLCGCYMGLDPNFDMNQIGIRLTSYKFSMSGHSSSASSSNPNELQLDHAGHGESASTEYYNDVELYFRYYITPKLRLFFSIPFSSNDIDGKKLNGVGDAKFISQYQLYATSIDGRTNFWQRVFIGGGFKLPTGVYNKTLTYGVLDPHFQPGTGSFDFLLNGLYMAKLEKTGLGWRNDIIYTLNTTNSNGYRFANRFNLTSTFTFDVMANDWTFLPHAGIYLETTGADTQDGKTAPDTGGNAFFGTGGLDIYYDVFSFDFNIKYVLSENLNGQQPSNDFRLFLGLGYSF